MVITNGGPAFPVSSYVNVDGETWDSEIQGMTLRDYFAAKAMSGVTILLYDGNKLTLPEDTALISYQMADAMLKARGE